MSYDIAFFVKAVEIYVFFSYYDLITAGRRVKDIRSYEL